MRRLISVAAITALTACEMGLTYLPPGNPELVVHGVLNAGASNQFVLLERTHTGSQYLAENDFSASDPITTDYGIPEENATVTIETPSGQVVQGFEDVGVTKIGGVYRFILPGASLTPGVHRLTVLTTKGDQVIATTVLPAAAAVPASPTRMFNRPADTVQLQWAAVPGARGYSVRIEGPYGPFRLMTEQPHLRLTGELRNVDAEGMPRVFLPGYTQTVSIVAVDSNFWDYYRSGNDPSTGTGLVNRVLGAIGFFGSVVPVFTQPFQVTAPNVEPIDGTFDRVPHNALPPYFTSELRLFLESHEAKKGQGDAITGNYVNVTNGARLGVLGTHLRDSVTLWFLQGQVASDTVEVFRGRLKGDTLSGHFSKGAIGIFARR